MLPDFLSDVSINYTAVPEHLAGARSRGVLWQAGPGRFLLDLPQVARFLVEEGERITIDRGAAVNEAELRRCARMTPLAALLYQRGMLALHAAAAVGPKGGAILIGGDSGAGTSTLLAALLERGWHFLADGLAAVGLNDHGQPMVYPISPEVNLWPDALAKLTGSSGGTGRQSLSWEERFVATPQPLQAIFRLLVHKGEIELADITGTRMFHALTTLSYNSRIADALFERAAFMRQTAAVTGRVPMHRLRRPLGRWCLDELAELLENACP
jgi:hypothetical protein